MNSRLKQAMAYFARRLEMGKEIARDANSLLPNTILTCIFSFQISILQSTEKRDEGLGKVSLLFPPRLTSLSADGQVLFTNGHRLIFSATLSSGQDRIVPAILALIFQNTPTSTPYARNGGGNTLARETSVRA